MPLPEQQSPRRHRQILDHETEPVYRFGAGADQAGSTQHDIWLRELIARLTGLVRKIGGRD